MWLDEVNGFAEIFKGYLPCYLLVALPIFIIMSPVSPVDASHEFTVYRMRQYDLHSVPHGCRSASFNMEGRSVSSWSPSRSSSRHCVVTHFREIDGFICSEIWTAVGAMVLVLPKNTTTIESKELIRSVEYKLRTVKMDVILYFAHWSPELEEIIDDLHHGFEPDDKSGSVFNAVLNMVSSNGYQIVVSAPAPHKLDAKMMTLHGKLPGRSGTGQTIIITTYYDAYSLAPELHLEGVDGNASGVAAFLELARIFSRLYSTGTLRGRPSIIFLLTSTGPSLNYMAAKKWLEEQLDSADITFRQDVAFVMSLDIFTWRGMVIHFSKPPQPGTEMHSFTSRLNASSVHKKIQLADEFLAWQHERFSIRRMPAFTVGGAISDDDWDRFVMTGPTTNNTVTNIKNKVTLVARALASYIYNLTNDNYEEDAALYDDALSVDEESIGYWYKYLSSHKRAPEFISTTPPNAGVTAALERALSRYMDVTLTTYPVDKREPEFALYGPTHATMYIYSVKPAVFDLVLTMVIVGYLTLVYFAMQYFHRFYEEYAKVVTRKVKVQ